MNESRFELDAQAWKVLESIWKNLANDEYADVVFAGKKDTQFLDIYVDHRRHAFNMRALKLGLRPF